MSKPRSYLFLMAAFLLNLTACAYEPVDRLALLTEARYWERSDASSAIYTRGPKAQQMLNRDIAQCVTEIRELYRLGAIRRVTEAEIDEYGIIPPEQDAGATLAQDNLDQWETPNRDSYLRAEFLDYHDFEGCMISRGWERLDNVPYDVAQKSRDDYLDAIIGEEYQAKTMHSASHKKEPMTGYEYDYPKN